MLDQTFRKAGRLPWPRVRRWMRAVLLAAAIAAVPAPASALEPDAILQPLRKYKPDFIVAQSAGYVGYLAGGLGWRPGLRDQHEFMMLLGYVPESLGGIEIWQFTFKYAWLPLQPRALGEDVAWLPVAAGVSVIRGYHERLWVRQPKQYPAAYYNPSALHATFNLGTALRRRNVEWFVEFAALDRGLAAYLENREYFQEHYAYYGLEGIGSLAMGAKVNW